MRRTRQLLLEPQVGLVVTIAFSEDVVGCPRGGRRVIPRSVMIASKKKEQLIRETCEKILVFGAIETRLS